MKHIGEVLKKQRRSSGLTLAQVAKKMKISVADLKIIEDTDKPHKTTIKNVCEAMGLPPAFVLLNVIERQDVNPSKQDVFDALMPSVKKMMAAVSKMKK